MSSQYKKLAFTYVALAITAFALSACEGETKPIETPPTETTQVSENFSEATEDKANWEVAIGRVEALRERLSQRQSEYVYVGSALNEVHVSKHSCAIIGRMIGKSEAITHIEVSYDEASLGKYDDVPGVSDYDLGVAINSVDNWLVNARRLLAAPQSERIREWNLDCVGQMGIPISFQVPETSSKTFYTLENEGTVLRVFGDVEEGFAAKLEAALDQSPDVEVVALGSAGGLVYEAMAAGLEIRQRHLETVLWNNCLSACTLVFLGGVERRIWSPYPELGFHRVANNGQPVPLNEQVYRDVAIYSTNMGVSSRHVLNAMALKMPDDMNYPDGDYLCAGSIITWMQRAYADC